MLIYEEKGINICKPLPSTFIRDYQTENDQLILKAVDTDLSKIDRAQSIGAAPKTIITQITKILLKISDLKNLLKDKTLLDAYEKVATIQLHKTNLFIFIESAKKAEFKGQKKKALDQYYEALYFLNNNDVDDNLSNDYLSQIKNKIAELEQ